MADDDVVIRSARNAFMVLLVLMVVVSAYQFVVRGGPSSTVMGLWVAAVVAFYGSKQYYKRFGVADG